MASGYVVVPWGWRREVEDDSVYYISPDLKKLSSQEELLLHLTSFGTCKCGLRCPFQFEDQFNFDPMILSLPAHIEHAQDTSSHCKVDHKFWETSASAKKSPSLKPSKAAIPLMFKHSNYMRPLVGQPVNYSLKNQSVLGKRALSSLSASRVDAVKKLKVRSTTFGAPAEANESEGGSVVSISAVENVAAAVGKQSASSFSSSSQMKSLKSQSSAAAGTLASLLSGPSDSGPCILTVTSEKPVSIPQPDSAISQQTPSDLLKVSLTLEKVDQASSPSNTDDGVSSTPLIEPQAGQANSDDLCVSGKEAESADSFEKMSKASSSSVEHLDDRRSISVDDDLLDTSHEQMEEGLPTPPVEGLEEPPNVSATDVPAGQQVDERDHSVSVVEDMEDTKAQIQGADLKDEGPDLKNEAPDLNIERPDLNIERPDLKIERPDLKNEEKNTDLMVNIEDLGLNIEEPDLKNEEPTLEEPALKSKELDDCISTTPDNSTSLTPCLPTTPDSECNDKAPTSYHQPTQEDSKTDVPLSEPSGLMPTSQTCSSEHSEYNDKAPTSYHQPTQEDSNKDVPFTEPSGVLPTSQTCTSDPSVFQSQPQTSEISPSVPVSSEPATASETERVENVSPPKEMNEESSALTCAQTEFANDNTLRSPLSPQVLVPPSSVPIEAEEPRHFDAPSSEATSVLTSAAVESLKVDPSTTGVGNSLTTDSSLKVIKHVGKSKSIPDSESPIKQSIQSSYSLRSRSVPPTSSSPVPSTSKSCVTLRPFHIPLSHFRDLSSRKRTSVDLESANGAEILSISPLKRIKLELIDIVACDSKSSKQEMTATTGSADAGSLFPVSGTHQHQGLHGDGVELKQEDIESMEGEGTPRVKESQKEELNDGSSNETQIQGKLLDSSTDEATTDAQMEMDPNPDSEVDAASIEQLRTAVITPQETSIDEPSNTDATSTIEVPVSYSEGECGHNELVSSQVGAVDGTEIDVIDIQPQARETAEKGNVQEHTPTSAAPDIAEPSDDIRNDFSSHEQIVDKSQSQIVPPLDEPALVVNPATEELKSTEPPVLETASLESPQASAQSEAKDMTNTQGVYEMETCFVDSEAILQPNSESVEMPPTGNATDCRQVHSTLPEAKSEASSTMEPKTATIEEDVSIGPSEDLPTATAPSRTSETIMKLEIVEEHTPAIFQPEACQSSPPKVNIKSEPLQEIEATFASVWDTIATVNKATSDCSSIHDIEPGLVKQEDPDCAHPAQTKLEPPSMIPQQEAAITLLDEIHEAVVAMELRPHHTQLGATSFEEDSPSNSDTPVDSFQRQDLPLHTQSSVTPVDCDQEFQKQHLILQAQANKLMEDAPASLNVADLISCFQDNELFSSVPKRSPSAGSGKSTGPTNKQYDYTSVGLSSSSCLESSDTTAVVEDRLLAMIDVSVDDSAKQVLPHSPGELEPQLHGECSAPGTLKGSRDTIMTPKVNPLPFVEESVFADATLQKLNSFLEDLKPQDSCATENPAQSHSEMHAQCMTFEPQLEPFAGDENEALNSTIATTSAPIESANSVPKPAFSINNTFDDDDRSSLQGEITKETLNISSSNASETLTSSDEMQTAFGVVTTTETATKDCQLHAFTTGQQANPVNLDEVATPTTDLQELPDALAPPQTGGADIPRQPSDADMDGASEMTNQQFEVPDHRLRPQGLSEIQQEEEGGELSHTEDLCQASLLQETRTASLPPSRGVSEAEANAPAIMSDQSAPTADCVSASDTADEKIVHLEEDERSMEATTSEAKADPCKPVEATTSEAITHSCKTVETTTSEDKTHPCKTMDATTSEDKTDSCKTMETTTSDDKCDTLETEGPIDATATSDDRQSDAPSQRDASQRDGLLVSIPLCLVTVSHHAVLECYSADTFSVGDVVWARASLLPAWPGRIISHTEREEDGLTPPPDGKAWVAWYGDTTVSLVDTVAMRPLSEGVKMRMKNKRTKPRKLPRPLLNAITEALEGIRERQEM